MQTFSRSLALVLLTSLSSLPLLVMLYGHSNSILRNTVYYLNLAPSPLEQFSSPTQHHLVQLSMFCRSAMGQPSSG